MASGFTVPRWAVVLCALAAGCATEARIDEDRAELVVARGYLESGDLHRWPECAGPIEFLEVVNCAPGLRSSARFRVEQPIVGTARGRVRVDFDYAPHWPELTVGPDARYLAVFLRDGRRYEMHGVAAVAQTEDGAWAIPVTYDRQLIEFPCTTDERQPEPLNFREPRPREAVSAIGLEAYELEDLEDEGLFAVEGGYLYAKSGVPLKHVPEAYAGKSPRQVAGDCH